MGNSSGGLTYWGFEFYMYSLLFLSCSRTYLTIIKRVLRVDDDPLLVLINGTIDTCTGRKYLV